MSIVLLGITLSPDMIWRERHASQGVVQDVRPTLGGVAVVFPAAVAKGLPVTLVASQRMGWIRRSVLDQVRSLAAVPGTQGELDFHGVLMNVIFRHPGEVEGASAVEFEPVRRTNLALAGDYMRGEIRLLTV